MAQVNFKVDEEIKKRAEKACSDMGLTLSSAINIFLTKVANERRIPFEITADPFYSEENLMELERRIAKLRSGKSHLKEHDLMELD